MTATAETRLKLERAWRAGLNWEPHEIQKQILEDDTRNQVLAAGRRAGKSETGAQKLLPKAFEAFAERSYLEDLGIRREYWIVGPEYSDAEKEFRKLYNGLRRLGVPFDKPGTYYNPHNGDMAISLWDSKFIVFAHSAKYPDNLVGEGLSGLVLSEAAKLKPTIYGKYLRPTLADFIGWTFMSSTPEGRNWFYRAWQAGQDPLRTEWRSWRLPAWVNPHVYRDMKVFGADADSAVKLLQAMVKKRTLPERLPLEAIDIMGRLWPKADISKAWEDAVEKTWLKVGRALGLDPEIISLILDLSEELFNQEEAALFNEFVGRVFKEFDEEIHVGDFKYDPAWKTYAALDYGFTNPFVWLLIQVDPFDTNIRILDEYYEMGKTTEEAVREIQGRGLAPGSLLGMYPDPAEPDRSRAVSGLLQVRSFGGTGGEIQHRLEWIRRKLKPSALVAHLDPGHEEWVPQLQINRRCKDTIREFNAYRYPKTADELEDRDREASEVPLKKDDHTPEALGRFMIGHYGSPYAEQAAPTRITRAKVVRRRRR
jgi:hypothetical protein